MDSLTKVAAFATIISAIIAVITVFLGFWRSKKKTQDQVSVTNSSIATLVGNSPKTTVIKGSPGITTIGRDLNVFHLGRSTGEERQNILEDREGQTHTGIAQQVSRQVSEISENLDEIRPSAFAAPILQQAHTKKANQELDKILMLRAVDPLRARQNIQELWQRTGEEGDLSAASNSAKTKVLYWTSLLCAGDAEMIASAKQLRNELRQTDPDLDLSIVDALLAEAAGDANESLRLLRDHDDPDSRTALFGVLVRSRGERDALDWYADQTANGEYGQFFTAVGWKNWAVCMAQIGKWKEAAQRLLGFESHWPEMPALAVIEGIINAAMLLPNDHRAGALKNVPLYQDVALNLVAEAEEHHSRAAICFEFAEQSLEDIVDHNLKKFIADWRLWVRLMDPDAVNANLARDEICQRMEEGAQAVKLMPFAWSFNIPFDGDQMRDHLSQRKQLGGLDEHELLAECLLFARTKSPRDLATYLEQHTVRLGKVMPLAFVTTMHAEALVKDNQTERARELVAEHAIDLSRADANRLIVMIDAHEGNDPRRQLELLYRQTGDLIDLKNLVSYLKTVDDRAALRPLMHDLFDRERTVENAHALVKCFGDPSFFDYEAIIKFLEDNPNILERSDNLKAAKAWALFQAGQLQDSRKINDMLRNQRINQDDFHLDINIAISSGDWERVPVILDREWPRRAAHDPEALMNLAQLAGQHGQTPDRALQLAKLAAEKAPDDPRILAAAHWLHFQLGRDDEADPDWLVRASELSSAAEGPLWCVGLQDLVAEWIPKRREHLREVERKWRNGEIPMGLAADRLTKSLVRLLRHIPNQNITELDGRHRVILPIVTGGRDPVELQEDWTIGLDVTSIMVLTHLDLLETAFDAVHHTKLAPDVMEFLFREKVEVRFHQPSRIRAAKQVRELQIRGQLRTTDNVVVPPEAITDEVGLELATILQMARHENGKVICVLPIHKFGSLMEQQADTSEYDDLIHSTMDLCKLLHGEGKIDTAAYQRASPFLNSQGQTECTNLSRSALNGPIYIDGLVLSHLQSASLLQPIAASGVDIRIHPDILEEANLLIEAGDVGDDLVRIIEEIRGVLRNAVESGAASFLPRTVESAGQVQKHGIQFQTTASLLAGNAAYGALCIEPARGIVIGQDAEFARRCGFETRQVFGIGTDIQLFNSELFTAAKEVLATNKERSVQAIAGKEVSVGLDMEGQNVVVKWANPESVPQEAKFPQLALLSPERETRIAALRSLIEQFGPTAPDFHGLLKNMETREANHQELSTIFNESANGVASLQTSLIQKINRGEGFNVADIIPQSFSYFERFAGPVPGAREPESYFHEVLIPYRKALLDQDVRVGIDICCLGALRDDLTPGLWVAAINDDAVWDAISSCGTESNPFSLLGALDIALYRQGDHRFRDFSAEAVTMLLDEQLGPQDGPDIYRLLQILSDFVLNRINLLENGPNYPGYWKRMCAWMQAGLIARSLTRSFPSIDVDALQEWTHDSMVVAGAYARLLDTRKEPMLSAGCITPQALRSEILGRIQILKSRHQSEGRKVPRSEDIAHALAQNENHGEMVDLGFFPGPLEGHRRPTKPIPQEVSDQLEDAWTGSAVASPLPLLVMASQFFALGKLELECALHAVKKIAENNSDAELHENLGLLGLASIVAAANRDTILADGIADAVVSVAPRISEEKDIQIILQIMLQAAAAHETHDAWFKWLKERLTSTATLLPPPPNECSRMFRDHLNEVERVLPVESWFHVRARSIASAGAV